MVYIVGTDDTYVTFKIILKNLVKKMPRQLKTWEKKKQNKKNNQLPLFDYFSLQKNQRSNQIFFFSPTEISFNSKMKVH